MKEKIGDFAIYQPRAFAATCVAIGLVILLPVIIAGYYFDTLFRHWLVGCGQ